MGRLVNGVWEDTGYGTQATGGRFVRWDSAFRHQITPGGEFPPEAGRYRLYVSLACPWAHRTMILRGLKKLEAMIPVSVVHWYMGAEGWTFEPGEGVVADPVLGATRMHQIYTASKADYSGRVTVPVLFDERTRKIVNNESSEIIRMLTHAFDGLGAAPGDYSPADLMPEIEAVNARVYDTLNNGVYKAGFATTQEAYEEALGPLFDTLGWLNEVLASREWLVGGRMTEADIRLFTTLVRFDSVYVGHFKCNLRRIVDYPHLWAYTKRMFNHPDIQPTVDFGHIKRHYYQSHAMINPTGIVPAGPVIDWAV